MTDDELLLVARAYADAAGISLGSAGRRSCGNDKIFLRLADGRGCHSQSLKRAAQWFTENWPADVAWPDGVSRPQREAA